jgi:hypothetical protein
MRRKIAIAIAVILVIATAAWASSTILNLTTRSPIDGTESVPLATAGANWKATISNIFLSRSVSSLSDVIAPTAWTPTYGAGSGTGVVATTNHANYTKVGAWVFFQIDFTITTVGTGTGVVCFTLPTTPLGSGNVGFNTGFNAVSAAFAGGQITSSAGCLSGSPGALTGFTNGTGTPIATNNEFVLTGMYQNN